MKRTNESGCAVSRLLKVCLVQAAIMGVAPSASANGVITWSGAQNISSDTDVSTNGTLVGAFNLGPVGVASTTVNGVTFLGLPVTGDVVTSGNFQLTGTALGATNGAFASGPFVITPAYTALLDSVAYEFGRPTVLTMSNLVPGSLYQFQWWSNYNASTGSDTTATAGNSVMLISRGLEWHTAQFYPGQYATGTFVADTTGVQTITFSTAYFSEVNGFQLRQVSAVPDAASTGGLLGIGALMLLMGWFRPRHP